MGSNSSRSIIDRIVEWLRGFFNQGASQIDRGVGRADEGQRRGFTQEGSRTADGGATDAAGRSAQQGMAATGTGDSASEAAEPIDEARSQPSDLDDAPGTTDETDVSLPGSGDPGEAYHMHDAVGGSATDDDTDGAIDTERDGEMASQHGAGDTLLGTDETDRAGGASADEFERGGYEPAHVDPEDVEAAAEGEPVPLEDDTATSDVGDLDRQASTHHEPEPIQDYNYGAGDLGVGRTDPGDASSTEESGADTGQSGQAPDASAGTGAPDSDRGTGNLAAEAETDTMGDQGPAGSDLTAPTGTGPGAGAERAARGDAFAQGDEAVTAPGQSEPDAFGDATTGTTEPSRSATGGNLEEGPDALGTTLDYSEESSETFDPDAANLSGEEEMTVSDLEAGEQPGSISGEESTRVTTFQSGTIAQEGFDRQETAQGEVDTPQQPYAGIDDEPDVQPSEEASGLDDFSGSDYPSDHRVDRLAGDDAIAAELPDFGQETSSAGDLPTSASGDDLLISEESPPEADDPGVSEGTPVDLDIVSASDDSVGNEPSTTELATGTAPGMALEPDDTSDSGDVGSATTLQDAADEGVQATPQALADDGGAGSASTQEGDVPAGAVRGDGGTEAPDGYPVKGNANSMIYHLPDFPSYKGTKAEFYFATEDDAIAAGYRAPGKRNRGRKR